MTNTSQSTAATSTSTAHVQRDSDDTDVASILTQLRKEVRARRQALSADEQSSASRNALDRELQRCAEQLEITRVVSAHWPLTGRTLFERTKNLVNKVIRRYLRWYINPIVEQQNQFNDVAARTLRLLVEAHQELREQMAEVRHQPESRNDNGEPNKDGLFLHNAHIDLPADIDTSALQAVVAQLGREEPTATFPDMEMPRHAAQLTQHHTINAHWPLEEQTPIQKGVAFIHKLTRFYLRWMINPIVEQQNACNAAIVDMVPHLIATDADMRAELAAQRARIRRLDNGA